MRAVAALAATLLVLAAAGACVRPRIRAIGVHVAMAPGTPDQVCRLCHHADADDAPVTPHDPYDARHDGCTGCHGPPSPAAPRPVTRR